MVYCTRQSIPVVNARFGAPGGSHNDHLGTINNPHTVDRIGFRSGPSVLCRLITSSHSTETGVQSRLTALNQAEPGLEYTKSKVAFSLIWPLGLRCHFSLAPSPQPPPPLMKRGGRGRRRKGLVRSKTHCHFSRSVLITRGPTHPRFLHRALPRLYAHGSRRMSSASV